MAHKNKIMLLVIATLLLCNLSLIELGQDQKKIDEAISKGCKYLLKNISMAYEPSLPKYFKDNRKDADIRAELFLLTLVHGGAFSEKDENCKKLLVYVLDWRPCSTYRASLKAMALCALNKSKYVEFIAECGQYLIDTQSKEGYWTYSYKIKSDGSTHNINPKPREPGDKRKVKLVRQKPPENLGDRGDNSNSQYAALGLRACYDTGIEIPVETLQLAKQWWEKTQFPDGHWQYGTSGGGLGDGTSTDQPKPVVFGKENPHYKYHPMTAGWVSSLCIVKYILGEYKKSSDFANDKAISAGLKWMEKNYNFVGGGSELKFDGGSDYYWFYALERSGMLSNVDKFGAHDWYKEGAKWLVENQKSDGSWGQGPVDTCFAILFLGRVTESLTH